MWRCYVSVLNYISFQGTYVHSSSGVILAIPYQTLMNRSWAHALPQFCCKMYDSMTPDIVCWRLLFNAGLKRNLLNQLNHTLEDWNVIFSSELNNPKVELLIWWPSHPSRLEASRLMSATVCLKALLLVPYPRNVVICGAPVDFNCPASKWRPFKLIQKRGW